MSSEDLSTLSAEQREALEQFTAVTDQNATIAIPFLTKCQWNAQIAITRFFDGDADTIDPAAEAAATAAAAAAQHDQSENGPPRNASRWDNLMDSIDQASTRTNALRRIFQPAPSIPNSDTDPTTPRPMPVILSLIFLPVNVVYSIVTRVFGALFGAFPGLQNLLRRIWYAQRPAVDRKPLSQRDTAARFIREFQQDFGSASGVSLPFQESGYNQARDLAKGQLKYLLVILLSPEHDDNDTFVRNTLLAPQVVDFIKNPSNNIILWAGSVQDSEAYQVSNLLQVTKLPFAGLIVHTPTVSSSAMSLVAGLPGPRPPANFISTLSSTIARHDQDLAPTRRDRQDQESARSIREQQNSAYERSLAQDRERARQRKKSAAAAEKAALEERQRIHFLALKEVNRKQWRLWRRAQLRPEPPTSAPAGEVSRVSIRLSTGERLVRRFATDAEIEELYAFVDCHGLEEESADSGGSGGKPAGYEHEYGFKLVSPMPREVFEIGDTRRTVGACIGRSGNLIAENIIPEDSE